MSYLWLAGTALGTWALSALLTWQFLDPRSIFHILDHPNDRSLHQAPVPRTGGVAILSALLVGGVAAAAGGLTWPLELRLIALGALAMGLVSFADDRFGLAPGYRLIAHLLVGGGLVAAGVGLERLELPGVYWTLPRLLAVPLSVLLVAWLINLYNFMDGMDGLAGLMALIGFSALGILGWHAGDLAFAGACFLIAAAAAGFLIWNVPPARIFMGDTGSSSLGFLVVAMTLFGAQRGLFPLWAALLIFSPFLVDATWTLLRRIAQGEKIWEAHRSHHYQRLIQAGWSHRKTLSRACALMLTCAMSAVQGVSLPIREQWLLIVAWTGIYALIGWKVTLMEPRSGTR